MARSLPRPELKSGEADEELAGWLATVEAVAGPLRAGIPEDEPERRWTDDERGRMLLADLLGWHRREEKPDWWRYFHQLMDMTDEERLEAREPLAMLEVIGQTDDSGRRFRYRFPEQDQELGREGTDPATGKRIRVERIDEETNEVELRFPGDLEIVHPRSLVSTSVVPSVAQEQRLLDIGRSVLDHGMDGDGPYRAARDLLSRRPPRIVGLRSGVPLVATGVLATDAARQLVVALDHTTLAIQGPPGAGKTWCGARMILDLVADGRSVGVTANSHKVIGKLLDEVLAAAPGHEDARARHVRIGQKPGDDGELTCARAAVMKDAAGVRQALAAGEVDVVGGTGWLWANEKCRDVVDVLFVDEAGQYSLANTVAVSHRSPTRWSCWATHSSSTSRSKGTHPVGAERSALGHLLGDAAVMPPERGLFLERTWRLHPEICAYTSEVFYDAALLPQDGNERQRLDGSAAADGEGIRFLALDHVVQPERHGLGGGGRGHRGPRERTCSTERRGRTEKASTRPIGSSDILVITPYNAQRKRIGRALASRGERCAAVPVGTVDKFQGQEAPISIYSMATSRPEDAPRGMEFLYSLNRLNVATSRARCLTVVVASPALVSVSARTPRQMELANALCRLVEVAR